MGRHNNKAHPLASATYRCAQWGRYVLCEFLLWGELSFLNCDDIYMYVINKQFELIEFVFESVHVDLQYDRIYFTFTAGYVCLCGLCRHVTVLGMSERLSSYPMWMR